MIRSALLCTCLLALAAPAAAQRSAVDALRQAARAAPRDYDAQLALGHALLEAGQFREAGAALRRAARLRREDPVAQFEAVRVHFAQRNHRRARAGCRAVSRLAPDSAIAHVCMARTWIAWRRSARALDEANAALAQAPNDYEALLALADAHRLRYSVEEAEAAYQRAARANPRAAAPHLGLGELYAQARRADDAQRALRRAHELDGDDPDIDYALGQLLEGEEAVAHLRDATSNRPGWAMALSGLGDALLEAGQAEDAIAAFREAIDANDELPQARAGLGRALMAAGQLEAAERALDEALEMVPNDADSVMARGDVYARTEREDRAMEQYQHAADLDPRDPEPLVRAARLALGQDRPVLALGFLQRVVGQHPDYAPAQALMGDVLRRRGSATQAREHYQRALRGEGPVDRAAVQQALRALTGG